MIELNGKYGVAKVFSDNVETSAMGQIIALLNQESMKDSHVRIMSDVHAGAGCVIGTTMKITDKVIPNLVGVDIGCGLILVELEEHRIELPKLDSVINKGVPSGFSIRSKEHKYCSKLRLDELECKSVVNMDRAYKSLGTLGGGNHFIEVNTDDADNKYLVIHTGSRNLGKQVAEHYQKLAWAKLQDGGRDVAVQKKIAELKSLGKSKDIQEEVAKIKSETCLVPYELAYCDGELFSSYIHDMKIVQEFANWNREAIAESIMSGMKWHSKSEFTTIHNYIDTENMILRKGSVSAQNGERLIVPINMRDGSLICIGKGNEDWNFSAPHGAGRLFSRSKAKETFTVSEFKKTMAEANVYSSSVCQSTLDECPMAYKSMDEIIRNTEDTLTIEKVIKPIYNFKSS